MTNPTIQRHRLTRTLIDLVRIDSVNPAMSGGASSEAEIAAHVGRELEAVGMSVQYVEPQPGRTSVVGRLAGSGGGRSLLLYAHLDTVGVTGMAAPFAPEVRDGRMYGRGAYDMKCGLAACIEAARAVVESGVQPAGDLLVAGVADEEVASIGMEAVLREIRADAAIVTEPTELELCPAHKGFCWIEVVVEGRAAHGSRFDEGLDANLRMGRVLAGLAELEARLRAAPPHPLLGPPSMHVGQLHGGTAPSVYAAECRAVVERRTLPGESEAAIVAEVQTVVDRVRADDPDFHARVRPLLTREPFEARAGSAIVQTVGRHAESVLGRRAGTVGMAYWMDAALLAAAGIDTVCIGPAGGGAHADVEWVELDSVAKTAEILARAALDWCA